MLAWLRQIGKWLAALSVRLLQPAAGSGEARPADAAASPAVMASLRKRYPDAPQPWLEIVARAQAPAATKEPPSSQRPIGGDEFAFRQSERIEAAKSADVKPNVPWRGVTEVEPPASMPITPRGRADPRFEQGRALRWSVVETSARADDTQPDPSARPSRDAPRAGRPRIRELPHLDPTPRWSEIASNRVDGAELPEPPARRPQINRETFDPQPSTPPQKEIERLADIDRGQSEANDRLADVAFPPDSVGPMSRHSAFDAIDAGDAGASSANLSWSDQPHGDSWPVLLPVSQPLPNRSDPMPDRIRRLAQIQARR